MTNIGDIISALIVTIIWGYTAYKTNKQLRETKLELDAIKLLWDNQTSQYDVLVSWQMKQVMEQAISREDFELAEQCKDIIQKIGTIEQLKITIEHK